MTTQKDPEQTLRLSDVQKFIKNEMSSQFQTLHKRFYEDTALLIKEAIANSSNPREIKKSPSGRNESVSPLNDQAVQYYYQGDLDLALQILEEATAANSSFWELWNNLGVTYSARAQPSKAIHAFEKAIALDAEQVTLLNNKGILALMNKTPEEALTLFLEAQTLEPHNLTILLNLAHAYETQERYSKAIQLWRLVTSIDPENEEATQKLKQYYQ